MNDHETDPFLVLLVILLIPVGILVLIGIGLYKAGRAISADMKSEEEARAIAALPQSDRRATSPTSCTIKLALDRREVFTTFESAVGRAYRVRFSGACSFTLRIPACRSTNEPEKRRTEAVDARFLRDESGNYALPHDYIVVDGRQLRTIPHEWTQEDRDNHTYEVMLDGTGKRFAIAFRSDAVVFDGRLTVEVTECPVSVLTLAARSQLAAERQEAEALAKAIEALSIELELERNWSDASFVEATAKRQRGLLLPRREELTRKLLALNAKPRLMAQLREHHPDLLRRLTGPIEAYLLAQRIAVQGVPEPKQAPPPKLRPLTAEERRALMVQKLKSAADDQLAVLQSAAEGWMKKAEVLRAIGFDEDEIARAIGDKNDDINTALAEYAAQKETNYVTAAVSLA